MEEPHEPARYELYYPEWMGLSRNKIGFSMLLNYEAAVTVVFPETAQYLFSAFLANGKLSEWVLDIILAHVQEDRPGEIPIDPYVTFVLTNDQVVFLGNAAALLTLVDEVRITNPKGFGDTQLQ